MPASPYRDQREQDIIRELASKYIAKESNRTSLVTVTNVILGNKGKDVTICFTVLPEIREGSVLEFLRRKRADFRNYMKENARLPIIPFVEFAIDAGEKNRQNIDRLV